MTAMALAVFLLLVRAASPSTLALRIVDENGRPVAARVRLLDSSRRPQPVKAAEPPVLLAAHPNFPELGGIVIGQASIKLPAGRSFLLVDRGPEYRRIEFPVEPHDGERISHTVRLERWIDMAAKGWWSGDLHVHRAPDDLPPLLDAADLHFAPTLTVWNDTSILASWPPQTVIDEPQHRVYSIDNCEDERPWGAALFIGVRSPMHLYPRSAQYPPPAVTWGKARALGGYIDLEKVIWWEAPVISALIPPDSIGVAVNHFREDGVSTRASLSRPRDETRYPGEQGFARYILDLYCHYLSAGFRIPASAGSANGVAKNALGYNRSYVYLGKRFSYDAWLAGQKAGRNFVTNGPMLFVTVNARRPGAVLPGDVHQARVKIDALSSAKLDRCEVLVDGDVARTLNPARSPSRLQASTTVGVEAGSWVAVRCFEKNPITIRMAHTSPVYFGRKPRRKPDSLVYLRQWVLADMDRIRTLPDAKLNPKQKDQFLGLCRKALRFYE